MAANQGAVGGGWAHRRQRRSSTPNRDAKETRSASTEMRFFIERLLLRPRTASSRQCSRFTRYSSAPQPSTGQRAAGLVRLAFPRDVFPPIIAAGASLYGGIRKTSCMPNDNAA
jgi:hypothetical protein